MFYNSLQSLSSYHIKVSQSPSVSINQLSSQSQSTYPIKKLSTQSPSVSINQLSTQSSVPIKKLSTVDSEVYVRFTLSVEKENSNLYKELLENDQLEGELEGFLKMRGITLKSVEVHF